MKKMKRFVALALSVVMVLAMSVMAFADGNNQATGNTVNVTLPSNMSNHIFYAYQIFTGTQAEANSPLGDVAWGKGINKTNFLKALKSDSTIASKFTSVTDVDDLTNLVKALSQLNSDEAKIVAKIAEANKVDNNGTKLENTNNTLEIGYYLIVDKTDVNDKDDIANIAVLQINKNITIENKTDKPSVEKKVKENTKYTNNGGYGDNYNDVADYNIGDNVPFELIGSIPDMGAYDTYYYEFVDTLSDGLTLNENSIHVYLASKKDGTGERQEIINSTTGTYWTTTKENQGFNVSFENLKTVPNVTDYKYIIVEYKAQLNSNAVIGLSGNENEVYLKYSNNPNQGGNGSKGETPKDKVIVFTYQLNVNKYKKDTKDLLTGAKFKLYRQTGDNNSTKEYAVVSEGKVTQWNNEGTELESQSGQYQVAGLDDGTYYLEETQAPAGYNKLTKAIKIEVKATTNNTQKWTEEEDNKVASDVLTALQVKVDDAKDYEDGDTGTGTVTVKVENSQGSTLPSTGGIGTTIFYIVGGILMVGAAVLLITKRRAEN